MGNFRKCKICGEELHVMEFKHRKKRSDGRHLICIDCEGQLDEKEAREKALASLEHNDAIRRGGEIREEPNEDPPPPLRDSKGRFMKRPPLIQRNVDQGGALLSLIALDYQNIQRRLTEFYYLLESRNSAYGRRISKLEDRTIEDLRIIKSLINEVNKWHDEQ